MLITVEEKVLQRYPEAEIGYMVAQVEVEKTLPWVEELKHSLATSLGSQGINATNFAAHPSMACWREVYTHEFNVNAKTFRSSLESLVRRVVTGKGVWEISSIVDLYNCCSILSLLPMGGYDLTKITGDIALRYAREGEIFEPLGSREKITTHPSHIIYADAKRVLCWLWNHKDCAETAIGPDTREVLFFIDALSSQKVAPALNQLSQQLQKIGVSPLTQGILNKTTPQVVV